MRGNLAAGGVDNAPSLRGMSMLHIVRSLLALLLALPLATLAAEPLRLRVIAFNDFHGHLEAGELTVPVPDPADPRRCDHL
jgi:2',3'-cyclic-nucleotide 2'-phosphodiesterase (5'-nucleotidase family)